MLDLSSFDFNLPEELIAQTGVEPRDHSRLLIFNRQQETTKHQHFYDLINELPENALIVFNNAKVSPQRLFGTFEGKQVEVLLLKTTDNKSYEFLGKPGKRLRAGNTLSFPEDKQATVTVNSENDRKILTFAEPLTEEYLEKHGQLPLPPYIKSVYGKESAARYQTVYAQHSSSIAAPTAGLHFTTELLNKFKSKFLTTEVTLHVGLGTFKPIQTSDILEHKMHSENYSLSEKTTKILNQALLDKRPIIAIGTTTTRVLEDQMNQFGLFKAGNFQTDIFIYPGYKFQAISGIVTNFHLPKSSLFVLISAFLGTETAKKVYKSAVEKKYRFYSLGDACLFL